LGKGKVKPYLKRSADRGKIHRYTAGKREEWERLGRNQLHYNCEGRRICTA